MNHNKRRIEQIKAKLNHIDKTMTSSMKQNTVSLVDILDGTSRKTPLKQSVSKSQRTINKSQFVHLDLTDNRFYEEAKVQMKIKKRMEDEVAKGYKKIANQKKLNSNSAQILSERLCENIAIAILNADHELTKKLRFEQIGKVLTDLRMFSVISFNENFEGEIKS